MDLKFYISDWNDYLDSEFDFSNDHFSAQKHSDRNDLYLHEIYPDNIPYDGILVSLAQLTKSKGCLKSLNVDKHNNGEYILSLRELIRLPQNLNYLGDCGAFSYKDDPKPAYSSEEAAKLYSIFGFDVGTSVDHMVVDSIIQYDEEGGKSIVTLTEEEKKQRIKITIENADTFIKIVNDNYKYIPLASVQGLSSEEYATNLSKYIEMGYEYIALGGLVPKKDNEISEILDSINIELNKLSHEKRKEIKIHLFGIYRPSLLNKISENKIFSFDSISYFRKAWLKSDKNYLTSDGKWYAALRVPQTDNPLFLKTLKEKKKSLSDAQKLEEELLDSLNGYNKRQIAIDVVLKQLLEYDKLFDRKSENGDRIRDAYKRTLNDRPWEQCDCPICRDLGIHVLIFRGFNRNKRRGFHNIYMQQKEFSHFTEENNE